MSSIDSRPKTFCYDDSEYFCHSRRDNNSQWKKHAKTAITADPIHFFCSELEGIPGTIFVPGSEEARGWPKIDLYHSISSSWDSYRSAIALIRRLPRGRHPRSQDARFLPRRWRGSPRIREGTACGSGARGGRLESEKRREKSMIAKRVTWGTSYRVIFPTAKKRNARPFVAPLREPTIKVAHTSIRGGSYSW